MKEIILGTGHFGYMWEKIFTHKAGEFISQNMVSYWCEDKVTNTDIKIGKDTKEGKKLTKMLEENESVDNIKDFLTSIVIRKMNPSELVRIINDTFKEGFSKGYENAQKTMRVALGLR